jgi:hypothetical protein
VDGHQAQVSNRTRILVYAMTLAVLVLLPTSREKAQTPKKKTTPPPSTWLVTLDVSTKNNGLRIKYGVQANGITTSCSPAPTNSATNGDITACAGDTVEWQGVSNDNNAQILIFVNDQVIGATAFSGSNGSATNPGTVGSVTAFSQGSHHKYSVLLVDDSTTPPRRFEDDPVIIIGGTRKP